MPLDNLIAIIQSKLRRQNADVPPRECRQAHPCIRCHVRAAGCPDCKCCVQTCCRCSGVDALWREEDDVPLTERMPYRPHLSEAVARML